MSVMKTCCGCYSTKSGTFIICFLYSALYLTGITMCAIYLGKIDSGGMRETLGLTKVPEECKDASDDDPTWWCKIAKDSKQTERSATVVKLVINSVLLVVTILTLVATCLGNRWLMLPFIVLEFLVMMGMALMVIFVAVVLGVYQPGDVDITTAIATAVVGVLVVGLFFYLWLCVVSHYQILGEIDQLGQDKVQVMQYPYDDPTYDDYPEKDKNVGEEKNDTPRTNSTIDVKEQKDELVDVDTQEHTE